MTGLLETGLFLGLMTLLYLTLLSRYGILARRVRQARDRRARALREMRDERESRQVQSPERNGRHSGSSSRTFGN